MTDHIPTCAKRINTSCPGNCSVHGEPANVHWWSGWPGAYCLKCGAEDADEICLGDSCECPCHLDEK